MVIMQNYKAVFAKIKVEITNLWTKVNAMFTKLSPLPNIYELNALFDGKLNVNGNAKTTSKLLNPISITLDGDVIGSVSTDLSGNVIITSEVIPTNHVHSVKTLSDLSSLLTNGSASRFTLAYNDATKQYTLNLRNQRLILSGDVTGYIDLNGDDDIVYLTTTVADNSHNHDITLLNGYSNLANLFAAKNHAHSLTSANISDFDSKVATAISAQIEVNNNSYFAKEGNRTILKI